MVIKKQNKKKKKNMKNETKLTQIQLEKKKFFFFQVGSLLGDGALAKRKENINARYHVRMGLLHKIELIYLYNIFKNLCKTSFKESNVYNKKTNKIYNVISFMTLSYPCFNDYYNLFYNNGKKSIPLNIAELLTASKKKKKNKLNIYI